MDNVILISYLLNSPETWIIAFCVSLLFAFGQTLGAGWHFPEESYFCWGLLGLLIGSIISLFISMIRLGVLF